MGVSADVINCGGNKRLKTAEGMIFTSVFWGRGFSSKATYVYEHVHAAAALPYPHFSSGGAVAQTHSAVLLYLLI